MPVDGPLPRTGDQQDIGADADRCFQARVPRDWRPHGLQGTDDYGLDYQVQTTPGQRATDIFRVQLKGTRSPNISSDGKFISIPFKASTIRYYDRIVEPILLVVCDLSVDPDPVDCPLYYVWVRDELRRIPVEELDPDQRYVTLRVPIENRLKGTTDLSSDIDAQNELARAGHALGLSVEITHPGMRVEERVEVVRRISTVMASRSSSFIDALAAAEEHWVDPDPGSLPWHLKAAEQLLKAGLLERASTELEAAESMLGGATTLETSDYWFQRGRLRTAFGLDQEASSCFKSAWDTNPLGKYIAAHVEAEIRHRYTGVAVPYPDLLELLQGDEAVVMSARSRVLAAEGKLDEAIAAADRVVGSERNAARAIAYTMFRQPGKALEECNEGLGTSNIPDGLRQLFLLLKARARFSLAQASTTLSEGDTVPPSGQAGIDLALVKEAWYAIQAAVDSLRDAGWASNVDHLADIWGATASMLGKQKLVLPEIAEAARKKPHLVNIQVALESLAAQCGEFGIALEANDRIPYSNTRNLRRTLLLHEANKHSACLRWFDDHYQEFDQDHELFGHAAVVAAVSAHKLSQPELVKKWSAALEGNALLAEYAALLQYYIATEINRIGNEEALERLSNRYEELQCPLNLAVALLQELNPTVEKQAAQCIELAIRIKEKVEPSLAMAIHVGLAFVTMRQWSQLHDWCIDFKVRLDSDPRMLAFEALAMDKIGETHRARKILEEMLEGGVLDSLGLNTYVTIMVRCGYVPEALAVAETILEAATSSRQRRDCIRLLYNLIQHSDPRSARLLALAVQMGQLADKNSEVEEGIYLVMFLMATVVESNIPAATDLAEYRQRAEDFFLKFPNSKIIKRGNINEDASGEELMAQLKEMAGISEDRESFQRKLENQLQRGLTIVPFLWRPKLVLPSVSDVVHLWEIAKLSSPDDRKYHLVMVNDSNWVPPSASAMRAQIPLLDMTALLVLFDLGLIDAVIKFFGKVAIAKATLEKMAMLVNPFSGSPMAKKCADLQDALKPHLDSIVQPSIPELEDVDDDEGEMASSTAFGSDGEDDEGGQDRVFGREEREIIKLCKNGISYKIYSDDFAFRVLVGSGQNPGGLCTLDVLAGMEEVGILTRQEVARAVSTLCGWNVGVVVRLEDLVALLPLEIYNISDPREGIRLLDRQPDFTAVISAVWDFRSSFEKNPCAYGGDLKKTLRSIQSLRFGPCFIARAVVCQSRSKERCTAHCNCRAHESNSSVC